jgi:hypothetical protein
MAQVFGCVFGSYTLGTATGRYLFAAGFDKTGSYAKPLGWAFAFLVIAVIGMLGLGRYQTQPAAHPPAGS